jgi:rod shape determining protein RodA
MISFDRRYFRYFDWISFIITVILLMCGLLFVFSSTYKPENNFSIFFKKQTLGIISGLVIYFICCTISTRTLVRLGFWGYIFTLILLCYTIIGGWLVMGAKRWISLYFIRFQPSELAKLFLPLFITHYLQELDEPAQIKTHFIPFKRFLFPLIALGIGVILILKQPDLGTALIILFSGLILLWYIGMPISFFIALALLCTISAPFLWKSLKPYQQTRLLVLMGYGNPQKERYQVEQSKIAIGSGGILGKGLLQGTQNKLEFLPEDHTDFIFSVMCEELGFVGAVFIIMLFCGLFTRILSIILKIPTPFETVVSIGLATPILLSVCINLGMVTGLLPTVGIQLPLFSYGITNLWVTLASLGGLNNIAIRRFYY